MCIEMGKDVGGTKLTDPQTATDSEFVESDEESSETEAPVTEPPAPDGKSLLTLIITQQLQYFVDRTGEPCLVIGGVGHGRAHPIRSRRARGHIAALAWKSGQIMLTTSDLERAVRVLEGLAWEQSPRDATRDQIWNSLQDKPVLQVVIELMREKEKHEARMRGLHKDLRGLASELKFDMYSRQWPKTPAHLSAQLRNEHHRGILEQCGISVEIERDRKGAKVVLRSVTPRIPDDDDGSLASPPASRGNSRSGSNLPAVDVGDGENERDTLEARIRKRMEEGSAYHSAEKENTP